MTIKKILNTFKKKALNKKINFDDLLLSLGQIQSKLNLNLKKKILMIMNLKPFRNGVRTE